MNSAANKSYYYGGNNDRDDYHRASKRAADYFQAQGTLITEIEAITGWRHQS